MDYSSIGIHIREYRNMKGLSQEEMAERAELSNNFISMLERGEKKPSIESLIKITNILEIPSDFLLADVLNTGYKVKSSMLSEKIEGLSQSSKKIVFEVLETLIKNLQ
ncbi:MAG: helix-turn-helix transcriptional regulator [Eubacterium sp.]|nr:helix-turn-helix transcriptional regulator [Eubacterium sp.]MDE6505708.1 helix-turn-helix transcriptional regulator [Eubacterium sp.]